MKMARVRDKQRDHERYMANREAILAQQKIYRETHKEEIKAKRQQREFEKRYLRKPKMKRDRKEYDHAYYLAHHDEICEKARKRSYERRKQQHTIGTIAGAAE